MRPHSRIPPYISRPTRDTAVLVVQMEPKNGDPVPALRIPLDRRTGMRLLGELFEAYRHLWLPADDQNHVV